MSTVLANIKSATHAVIDGFNAGDVDAIMAPRAPNCTFNILPKSMNRPANGNEEYRAFITRLLPVLKNFTLTPQSFIFDPESRKSVVHTLATGDSPIGRYENEWAVFFSFNEAGDQIVRVDEMVDSAFGNEFFAKMEAFMKAHAQRQGEAKA